MTPLSFPAEWLLSVYGHKPFKQAPRPYEPVIKTGSESFLDSMRFYNVLVVVLVVTGLMWMVARAWVK
jgi:hypothetical protein